MKKPIFVALLTIGVSLSVFGQERALTVENPMAALKDEVQQVLVQAQLPFSPDQEKAIVLMMEDRRKASEDLFGSLMDFSSGPKQGQIGRAHV